MNNLFWFSRDSRLCHFLQTKYCTKLHKIPAVTILDTKVKYMKWKIKKKTIFLPLPHPLSRAVDLKQKCHENISGNNCCITSSGDCVFGLVKGSIRYTRQGAASIAHQRWLKTWCKHRHGHEIKGSIRGGGVVLNSRGKNEWLKTKQDAFRISESLTCCCLLMRPLWNVLHSAASARPCSPADLLFHLRIMRSL